MRKPFSLFIHGKFRFVFFLESYSFHIFEQLHLLFLGKIFCLTISVRYNGCVKAIRTFDRLNTILRFWFFPKLTRFSFAKSKKLSFFITFLVFKRNFDPSFNKKASKKRLRLPLKQKSGIQEQSIHDFMFKWVQTTHLKWISTNIPWQFSQWYDFDFVHLQKVRFV